MHCWAKSELIIHELLHLAYIQILEQIYANNRNSPVSVAGEFTLQGELFFRFIAKWKTHHSLSLSAARTITLVLTIHIDSENFAEVFCVVDFFIQCLPKCKMFKWLPKEQTLNVAVASCFLTFYVSLDVEKEWLCVRNDALLTTNAIMGILYRLIWFVTYCIAWWDIMCFWV